MSYRIAWVRFTKSGRTYPVNCHRRDLQKGDIVVVDMLRKNVRQVAEVDKIEFLNWNCINTILCKRAELVRGADGEYAVARVRSPHDIPETPGELIAALKAIGWREFRSTSNVWQRVLAKSHPTWSGLVAFRTNGIDFQIFENEPVGEINGSFITIRMTEGHPFIRNWYFNSQVDLFEHTLDFSRELQASAPRMETFLDSIGQKPPPPPKASPERDDLAEIRDAITGGMGGPAYLSDGVWI